MWLRKFNCRCLQEPKAVILIPIKSAWKQMKATASLCFAQHIWFRFLWRHVQPPTTLPSWDSYPRLLQKRGVFGWQNSRLYWRGNDSVPIIYRTIHCQWFSGTFQVIKGLHPTKYRFWVLSIFFSFHCQEQLDIAGDQGFGVWGHSWVFGCRGDTMPAKCIHDPGQWCWVLQVNFNFEFANCRPFICHCAFWNVRMNIQVSPLSPDQSFPFGTFHNHKYIYQLQEMSSVMPDCVLRPVALL